MASAPLQPSYMELWGESGIPKPEPLRIVKERAKTIASCGTPRAVPVSRRGSARSSHASRSPPEAADRPLTIPKKRKTRRSVIDFSFSQVSEEAPDLCEVRQAAENHISPREDNLTTPRARQPSARTASVGSFLKSELFRGSFESDRDFNSSQSVRLHSVGPRNSFHTQDPFLFPTLNLGDPDRLDGVSDELGRRHSKGRRFISKALGSLGNARSKSMQVLRSNSSKDSLPRNTSLRNLTVSRPRASEALNPGSSRFSFEHDSVDIADNGLASGTIRTSARVLLHPSFLLHPEITVVPEVDTVDAREEASVWAAILVTGVLRKTGDCRSNQDPVWGSRNSSFSSSGIGPDNTDYGYLYGVDINLTARFDCLLETVIVENNDSSRLYLGQTEFILAKIKLPAAMRSPSHVRESSKDLIAELENRLGSMVTDYLTISISYRHSAFPAYKGSSAGMTGISYSATTAKTEAHAVMKRHCSQSPWGKHNSINTEPKGFSNPVILLISSHFDPLRAQELIKRITVASKPLVDLRRRESKSDRQLNSSSETIVPGRRNSYKSSVSQNYRVENSMPPSMPKESLDITQARINCGSTPPPDINTPQPKRTSDPARKIWSEMRRSSRGTRRVGPDTDGSMLEAQIQMEQARIMELVVRNKRSLGADTLRSLAAPAAGVGMGLGLGLGIGAGEGEGGRRGWGWGPPWW